MVTEAVVAHTNNENGAIGSAIVLLFFFAFALWRDRALMVPLGTSTADAHEGCEQAEISLYTLQHNSYCVSMILLIRAFRTNIILRSLSCHKNAN